MKNDFQLTKSASPYSGKLQMSMSYDANRAYSNLPTQRPHHLFRFTTDHLQHCPYQTFQPHFRTFGNGLTNLFITKQLSKYAVFYDCDGYWAASTPLKQYTGRYFSTCCVWPPFLSCKNGSPRSTRINT